MCYNPFCPFYNEKCYSFDACISRRQFVPEKRTSGRCGTEFNEFRYNLQNMVTEGKKHSTLSFISRKKKACSHRDQWNFERIRRQWAKQTTKCNLFIIEWDTDFNGTNFIKTFSADSHIQLSRVNKHQREIWISGMETRDIIVFHPWQVNNLLISRRKVCHFIVVHIRIDNYWSIKRIDIS